MGRCALALGATAAVLAAVDLVHKAAADAAAYHARSAGYVVFVLVFSAVWAATIVLTRSGAMAIGGGVLAGGAVGNVASLVFWPGVPNPIEVGAIVLNLADLFVLVGFLLVAFSALRLALADRGRLLEPVRLR